MKGYCVRCKDKGGSKMREMKDVKVVQTKNGRYMAKGTCACGTGMRKFLSKEDAEALKKSV